MSAAPTPEKEPSMTDTPHSEPILATLQKMHNGRVVSQLSDEIATVVAAVLATGKKGSVTLQLSISADGADRMLSITPAIKHTKPQPTMRPAVFWGDEETGALFRSDPAQTELPGMTVVDGTSTTDSRKAAANDR